jgi:uncharacterized phage infection (PIP) family protein YhgE
MDEILKQILSELKDQGQRLGRMEKGQDTLRQGQEALISRVGNLEQGQAELRQGQETLISRVGNLEQGQETLLSHVGNLEKNLTKLAIHVEGEITEKIKVLFDGHSVLLDILARIEERQSHQDKKLNLHWQEIMVPKNKKRR